MGVSVKKLCASLCCQSVIITPINLTATVCMLGAICTTFGCRAPLVCSLASPACAVVIGPPWFGRIYQ